MEAYRITRLSCGRCGKEQRVRFLILENGMEQESECASCGPTEWVAFPQIDVSAVYEEVRRERMSENFHADPDVVPNPIYMIYAISARANGEPLCEDESCPVCAIRRRFES